MKNQTDTERMRNREKMQELVPVKPLWTDDTEDDESNDSELDDHVEYLEFLRTVVTANRRTPTNIDTAENHQCVEELYATALADLKEMVAERYPARHAA